MYTPKQKSDPNIVRGKLPKIGRGHTSFRSGAGRHKNNNDKRFSQKLRRELES